MPVDARSHLSIMPTGGVKVIETLQAPPYNRSVFPRVGVIEGALTEVDDVDRDRARLVGVEHRNAVGVQELDERAHRIAPVVVARRAAIRPEIRERDRLTPELFGALELHAASSREPGKEF